jgi:hypothetical protein
MVRRVVPISQCRRSAAGMTFLEVMIAILLFAMFTGVTVMVTELMAAMVSRDSIQTGAQECGVAPVDRACLEQFLDELVGTLEQPVFPPAKLLAGLRQCKPTAEQLLDLSLAEIPVAPWPPGYTVCLYDYGSVNPAYGEDLESERPGLYLLQAQPVQSSPLRQPVQRLFCRPRLLCT